MIDDGKHRFWLFASTVFAQPPEHIFDIDNGIIHNFAYRNGEAPQCHGIDRAPQPLEHNDRNEQRKWNCRETDHARSPTEKKKNEDNDDQNATLDHRRVDVRDRSLDEVRLAEDRRIENDIGWE